MKTLLVPCDGSDNALRALRHAISKAAPAGESTEIELLYVMAPYYAVSFPEPVSAQHLDARFPARARQALQQAAAILQQSAVRYKISCRWAPTEARGIVAHAREHRCAAIIMGTRGLSPLANLAMGSVAMQVAHGVADLPGIPATFPVTFVK